MTVHQRNEETRDPSFPSVSPLSKNHWPAMDNDSSSWDRNSRATSSSWPGDMEETATRKILQLWRAIEQNIYGENDEISSERSSEECDQWKNQLIHLRLVGRGESSMLNQESSEIVGSGDDRRKSGSTIDRNAEELFMVDKICESRDLSENSHRPSDDRNNVFDQIFEYVCNELARRKNENKDSLSKNLDEVLRITPAPTCEGKKWTNGGRKRDQGAGRETSANENRSGLEKSVDEIEAVSPGKDRSENDNIGSEEIEDAPQVARNKLGTVFNEKIVVSPVPFVVSTRESFTTLRTTPISFRAENFKVSSSQGLGRYMNSANTMNSGRKIAPSRLSQIHSAWQAPVCPTVWPKNIKLAPIDPSRLPSSKIRSSIDSMAALPHRNRNSLSPILRPLKPVTSADQRNDSIDGLEIQGRKILTQSAKKNLSNTTSGWQFSPRSSKNSRIKARITKR